ncbi:hypothetical protein GE21DRAFT_1215093 [Neurospora crassa]|nr:hypothetical protein GE21DRAFT_1215093 [Neurospora crassa]
MKYPKVVVTHLLDVRRAAGRAFGRGWASPMQAAASAGKHWAAYARGWCMLLILMTMEMEYPSSKDCLRSVPAVQWASSVDIQRYIPRIRQVGLPSILRRRTPTFSATLPIFT